MKTVDQQLVVALGVAARIGNSDLQREMLLALCDLQAAWRTAAEGFICKQRDALDEATNHISEVAEGLQIDEHADLRGEKK